MNLFSIFDPSSSSSLSLNWMSLLLIILLFPNQYWMVPSRYLTTWFLMNSYMYKEFINLIYYSYSNIITFITLLSIILMNNFMGLFPYIFTASSHLTFSLSLSLMMWFSMMIYSIFNYLNMLMSHLTPQNTPSILMPFMVIIESISLMIRPFTLSIRLSANMIAGHLLLSLLGTSFTSINSTMMMIILILSQCLLYMLEIGVSLIQAYVFSILSILYSSEF